MVYLDWIIGLGCLISGILSKRSQWMINSWVFTMGIVLMASYLFSVHPGAVVNDNRRVDWMDFTHQEPDMIQVFIYNKPTFPSIRFQIEWPIRLNLWWWWKEPLTGRTQFQKIEAGPKTLINFLKTDPGMGFQARQVNKKRVLGFPKSKKKLPELPSDYSIGA